MTLWLVAIAAAVTLGHLIGPHSQIHVQHDEHDELAEAVTARCDGDAEGEDHHDEANCGYLLPAGTGDASLGTEWAPDVLVPVHTGDSPRDTSLGPNGRAPPERSLLQISRV